MLSDSDRKGLKEWWNEIDSSRDWGEMTNAERVKVVSQLHDFALELVGLNLDELEIAQMIRDTSVIIVFHSIARLWTLPDKSSKQGLTKYLKTTVINSFEEAHGAKMKFHREVVSPYRETGEPVSLETIRRLSPLNFRRCSVCETKLLPEEEKVCRDCKDMVAKSNCKYCDKKLQRNNQTGICRKCQQKSRKVLEKQYGG